MKKLEKNLKALANANRLKILQYIKNNKSGSVSDISTVVKCHYKTTSKHLAILFQVDVLDREQSGNEMIYSLADKLDEATIAVLKLI